MHERSREQALVERAQAGDRYAFGDLVGVYSDRVRGVVVARMNAKLRERAGVEDVIQETFLRAWERTGSFRWGRRHEGLVFRVARRDRGQSNLRGCERTEAPRFVGARRRRQRLGTFRESSPAAQRAIRPAAGCARAAEAGPARSDPARAGRGPSDRRGGRALGEDSECDFAAPQARTSQAERAAWRDRQLRSSGPITGSGR